MQALPVARSVVVITLLAVAAPSGAAAEGTPDADTSVDITPVRDKLKVLKAERGHYFVVEPFKSDGNFYFGDGKQFYRQRSRSSSSSGKEKFSISFWSPRTKAGAFESLEFRDAGWKFSCDGRKNALTEITGDGAAKILKEAKFAQPRWRYTAFALARDDFGRYYYVDRLQDRFGGRGFRVFAGKKGAMKLQKMSNIVLDSEGAIFSTKRGQLRLIFHGDPRRGHDKAEKATWVRKKRRTGLVAVPLYSNVQLIYEELGPGAF
jgi:hypothetical protein